VAEQVFSAHAADCSFTIVCITLIFLWHPVFQGVRCEKYGLMIFQI